MSLDNPFGGEVKIGLTPKPAQPSSYVERIQGAPIEAPLGTGQRPRGWGKE